MADHFRIEFSPAHWVGVEEDQPGGHRLRMTRVTKTVQCRRLAFTSFSWGLGM